MTIELRGHFSTYLVIGRDVGGRVYVFGVFDNGRDARKLARKLRRDFTSTTSPRSSSKALGATTSASSAPAPEA